jgi:SAM-dependent methyltransferase
MHPSAMAFAVSALAADDVAGKVVLEAGAYDVNGSVRPHVESLGPKSYLGTDPRSGPGVDLLCAAEDFPALLAALTDGAPLKQGADVVISTEMLEHAADWQAAMRGMISALAPGGLLVLTTRSEGFPLHGYPDDHWRFSVDAMGAIVRAAGLDIERLEADPDPASPGVFVKARKPPGWSWPDVREAWDCAGVTAMPR